MAAFYRFFSLPHYAELRAPLLERGAALDLRGSILLASEGVNGTISGSREGLEEVLRLIADLGETSFLEPKWSYCDAQPFARWKVRLKKEIVALKTLDADPLAFPGHYATPQEWNELLGRDDVTVIDVRNSFELGYGTFPGAVDPETRGFREFTSFARERLTDKSKPIAMFCTGGIRCEKAAAYLAANGYQDVVQLKGGILGYLEHVQPEENRWQGSCFVFDERVALGPDLKPV